MAQEKTGQQTTLGSQPKAKASRRQLVGTIVGIAAAVAVLVLLKVFGLI